MANRIETIGIVGAGTMGNGIAQVSAVAGLKACGYTEVMRSPPGGPES
jgi:3-hydroxyacyl-CoA dehydrogenase